jgi:hypothetical protein
MKADKLIVQRFDELEQRADALLANKEFDFEARDGTRYFNVNYAEFRGWATNALNLLSRIFSEDSVHYKTLFDAVRSCDASESPFRTCKSLFQAAREDYEGGYLFNVRGLVQAEVFSDVLDQATELLRAGYKDPACVAAGVALETTLKELCTRNGIPHAKLDRMNADLCKAGVYNMGMQKQITAWAERRNRAAHGDWATYNDADVEEMIRGVTRLIADYL